MKYVLLIVLWCLPVFGTSVYTGDFSQVNVSSADCNELFEAPTYDARLIQTGSGGTTAVLHFESETGVGFFHEVTMVGNTGAGDLYFNKTLERNGKNYDVAAEGIFDLKFVYLEIKVDVSAGGVKICTGTADFSGF